MIGQMSLSQVEFDALLSERQKLINEVLSIKGKEYAFEGDRAYNFNAGVQLAPNLYKTREEAAQGYNTKQLSSIQQMIIDLRAGIVPTVAVIKEKFGDVINYFILMEIMFLQRARKNLAFQSENDLPF